MFSQFLQSLFLISAPGGSEWILIILAVLILFGGRKIPEFMRGLGKGMREFNDAKNNVKREFEEGMNEQPKQTPPPSQAASAPAQSATTQTTATNNPN